jgi:hypothetical protein
MTNTGEAAHSIVSIAVTGVNASSFVFANTCGSSLLAGANCTIHGHFAPAVAGAYRSSYDHRQRGELAAVDRPERHWTSCSGSIVVGFEPVIRQCECGDSECIASSNSNQCRRRSIVHFQKVCDLFSTLTDGGGVDGPSRAAPFDLPVATIAVNLLCYCQPPSWTCRLRFGPPKSASPEAGYPPTTAH